MAAVSTAEAIRLALRQGGGFEDAAVLSHRWMRVVTDLLEQTDRLLRESEAVEADELSAPLYTACSALSQAQGLVVIAWWRLNR